MRDPLEINEKVIVLAERLRKKDVPGRQSTTENKTFFNRDRTICFKKSVCWIMQPIYFYFKETLLDANNKFTVDFSNTELVYHINFCPKNDYNITTMNCNLIIANSCGDVTQDIKDLSEKSRLLLEKGADYHFTLAFVYLLYYYPSLKGKTEVLVFYPTKKIWNFSALNINFKML